MPLVARRHTLYTHTALRWTHTYFPGSLHPLRGSLQVGFASPAEDHASECIDLWEPQGVTCICFEDKPPAQRQRGAPNRRLTKG